MKTKPVAAVCDRRMENEPMPIETPEDKPVRCSGGLRPPKEDETGAHRDAATGRRLRFPTPRSLAAVLCLLPLLVSAAPKKDSIQPVDPTVVYDATVKVLRGGTCEVPLRAISPQGYDVKFEILSGPGGGSLSGPQRNSKSSVSYFYTHDGKKGSPQDSFRFKCKSGPQKAWGYAKATILVEEPPARFSSDVSALDFGAVFLGESRTLPIRIKNAGGSQLQGRLKVAPPWKLVDPSDLKLAEGEAKKILITFEPFSTDTQRGSMVLESGAKPFPEITLQGLGATRFEVPEKAAFEQLTGASELRIPVKNLTASPLSVSVHCPPPLEAPDSIQLLPDSSAELVLTLPARPFAEKSTLVTLSDGASTRDIRIQLPPSPSRLEWEIDGKNQLGNRTPGRLDTMTAKLHNTGTAPARAVIRTTGDGFALASGKEDAFVIAPGEHALVHLEWKFPDKPGAAQAILIAETDGLSPLQETWEADIQSPSSQPESEKSNRPRPIVSASPTPAPPKVLSAAEAEALRKRLPGEISYRLEPELHWTSFFRTRRTAAAILSWNYEGPQPVEFIIQREVQQRKGFFDKNPFDRTLPTPDDLPPKSLEPVWTTLKGEDAKVQELPDGRWQARIPSLFPGYHKVRIIAKLPGSKRMNGVDFSFPVGDIPLPPLLSWTLPGFLALCATYLLRNKIRSLFG
jgi:hypothetical protein